MSQGILDVVKQKIVGMNIYISGISELFRMEMGEFTTMGKNPLEEME